MIAARLRAADGVLPEDNDDDEALHEAAMGGVRVLSEEWVYMIDMQQLPYSALLVMPTTWPFDFLPVVPYSASVVAGDACGGSAPPVVDVWV